jgi:hypothetical protein
MQGNFTFKTGKNHNNEKYNMYEEKDSCSLEFSFVIGNKNRISSSVVAIIIRFVYTLAFVIPSAYFRFDTPAATVSIV